MSNPWDDGDLELPVFPGVTNASRMHNRAQIGGNSKFTPSFEPVTHSQLLNSSSRGRKTYSRNGRASFRNSEGPRRRVRGESTGGSTRHGVARKDIRRVLPSQFWPVFPYETFNVVQSNCLEAFQESHNMVVSAPTGSGKTVIFELAICKLIHDDVFSGNVRDANITTKVVYLAPIKALCSEKASEWKSKFSVFGLSVEQVTGDNSESLMTRTLSNVDVICTTPEKWDSLTRQNNSRPGVSLASTVRLMLVDEVHHLNDKRGAALEAVIARMMLTSEQSNYNGSLDVPVRNLRIIAASATIPNVQDIAEWIKAPLDHGIKQFDESARPVKLEYKVLGFRCANQWTFDRYLNSRLLEVINKYNDAKPVIVFCSTRKSTYSSAAALTSAIFNHGRQGRQFAAMLSRSEREELAASVQNCSDKSCREYLPHGIAIHNGGLSPGDRHLIEGLFRRSVLKVIFTTTTLASGVNLPAHLVVLKGTQVYVNGKMREIERNTICQMLGRAGRPQFDDSGVAVIMTTMEKVREYELVCRGAHDVVESQLRKKIPEHINAEISRGTISDVPSAIFWLKATFLRIRIGKNPRLYNFDPELTDEDLEEKLKLLVVSILNDLAAAELISYDVDGFVISSTEAGDVMAQHYISFQTMKMFHEKIAVAKSPADVLKTLVEAQELVESTFLRRAEKKKVNEVNQAVRFSLPGKVKTPSDKIFCLIQVLLGDQHDLLSDDTGLRMESQRLLQIAARISRSLAAYVLCIKESSFSATEAALRVKRSVDQKVWWDGGGVVRQLPGVGLVYGKQLVSAGVHSMQDFAQMSPRKIEAALKKNPPFGNELIAKLNSTIPHLSVAAKLYNKDNREVKEASDTSSEMYLKVRADVKAWDGSPWKGGNEGTRAKRRNTSLWSFLLIGCHGQAVVHHSRIKIGHKLTFEKKIVIPAKSIAPTQTTRWIEVRFASEDFVGADATTNISIPGEEQKTYNDDGDEILDLTQQVSALPRRSTCGHNCKNKHTCRHQSCKGKVTKKRKRPRKLDTPVDSLTYLKRKTRPLTASLSVTRLRDVKKRKLENALHDDVERLEPKGRPKNASEIPQEANGQQYNGQQYNPPILIRSEASRTGVKQASLATTASDTICDDEQFEYDQIFQKLAGEPEKFNSVCKEPEAVGSGRNGLSSATARTEFDDYNDAIASLF